MNIKDDYNAWARNYDSDQNKTRDLEGIVLRKLLGQRRYRNALEAGCGTGKNTVWLKQQCEYVDAVDFSTGMLDVARAKVSSDNVTFRQLDLLERWPFRGQEFDLVVFSLVLEHIQDLNHIFSETARVLSPGGMVYLSELHPFRQYLGAKARIGTGTDPRILTCYTHHTSSFYDAATKAGLKNAGIAEHFDDAPEKPPRLLTLLFEKAST